MGISCIELEQMVGGESRFDREERSISEEWAKDRVWFQALIPEELPWGDEALFEALPESAQGCFGIKVNEYAYLDGQRYQPGNYITVGSVAEIGRLLGSVKKVSGILVPWYDRLIPMALWTPYQHRVDVNDYRSKVKRRFFSSLAITVGFGAVAYFKPEFLMMALLGAVICGLNPLVESVMAWFRKVDQFSVTDLNEKLVKTVLFSLWVVKQPTKILKIALGVLVLVFAGQLWLDHNLPPTPYAPSVQSAALIKDAVLSDGEWWRIVTAGLMHGGPAHIFFNGFALFNLGRVLVALVSPSLLSIVFLVSVITGSLCSLYWGQAPASVGASGGILGCLGFLLVVTHKFREELPGYLRGNLIIASVVIAIFGLLGSSFIDNAAHAGGFAGGVALGQVFRSSLALAPANTGPVVKGVSWVCVSILSAGVLKIGWELWQTWVG